MKLHTRGHRPIFIEKKNFSTEIIHAIVSSILLYTTAWWEYEDDLVFDSAPGALPPPESIGERGGAGGGNEKADGDQGQNAPEYKSVELVRQNFPEAWIWSQFKTTGYA